MDDKLLNHFRSIQQLSDEEIDAIDETLTVRSFKKGTLLLKEGQHSSDTYFVLEGIVRQYYITDGTEKTSDFFTEGQWVLSANHITQNTASNHFVECCSDCKLIIGNSEKGEDLYEKFPNLGTVSRKLMSQVFVGQQTKLEAYILDSPKERYLKLLKSSPELFQKIPQYQIASYVGVTPESLSRIRKRLALEG
nr:Crp/Fnr family transcriptional regulator [uncultured Fluviicola sp.]